jgi:hypothetical protein
LYAEALAFARERGAKRMVTNFTVAHEDDPAVAFLTERGFTELERDQPSYLDVATLDLTPFLPAVERAEAQGVRFFTYADAGDTEENRQRLFALTSELDNDVPHRDAQARIPAPYEQWVKYDLGHPQFRAHLMWLAEQDAAPGRRGAGAAFDGRLAISSRPRHRDGVEGGGIPGGEDHGLSHHYDGEP